MNDGMNTLECIEDRGDGDCRGEVNYYDVSDSGRAFPRCIHHLDGALERDQKIRERYPHHAPSDFDPDDAGERWDDDY